MTFEQQRCFDEFARTVAHVTLLVKSPETLQSVKSTLWSATVTSEASGANDMVYREL
jgi:hypothetical protein